MAERVVKSRFRFYLMGQALIIGLVVLVGIQWITDAVKADNLLLNVPQVELLSWLESPYTYFYLHLFTFVPVFALSFDRNVHYYTRWKALLPAILVVGAFFIAWDVFFTAKGVWNFNENYLSGIFLFNLPIEEWLFFITVPFACIFIYECLNFYVKKDILESIERPLTIVLIIAFLIIGLLKFDHMYTATTFLLTSAFLLFHLLFIKKKYRSRFYLAYLVSWIPFMLVNGVLTGGYTNEPIVIYNPEEYFGIRITSVPFDDSIYSMLMLLMVTTIYEKLKTD
ncbi:MAG: lycopene cyclase domain-containing protein [Bacteroidota bacterium]